MARTFRDYGHHSDDTREGLFSGERKLTRSVIRHGKRVARQSVRQAISHELWDTLTVSDYVERRHTRGIMFGAL